MTQSAPSVLVLVSPDSEPTAVTNVLASLQALGADLHAFDAGRLGDTGIGAVDWVVRAISGEVVERKLDRELARIRPDAVVCFDVGSAVSAVELCKNSPRAYPVLAVIPELSPDAGWAKSAADRYLVVDDEAAVDLQDLGIVGHRILAVGNPAEYAFVEAAGIGRDALKKQFGLQGKVVLVHVAGMGHEESSKLALQLSLISTKSGSKVSFLFDAGHDRDAAAAIRAQVPLLEMRAQLFGDTEDSAKLWGCADVVVARPRAAAISRALCLGTKVVCLSPAGKREERCAAALVARTLGVVAANSLLAGAALERMLNDDSTAPKQLGDPAANIAAAAWLVGMQRQEMVEQHVRSDGAIRREDIASAAEYGKWASSVAKPASGLEDLSGARSAPAAPDPAKLQRMQLQIRDRKNRVTRTIGDAQKQVASWDAQRAQAEKLGNDNMGERATRNADMERARMHAALAEMADLVAQEQALELAVQAAAEAARRPSVRVQPDRTASAHTPPVRTPPRPQSVEEELARLRRSASHTDRSATKATKRASNNQKKGAQKRGDVDDELARLKRRMANKNKR